LLDKVNKIIHIFVFVKISMNVLRTRTCASIAVETRLVRIVASARGAFDWLTITNTAVISMSVLIRFAVVRVNVRILWAAFVVSVATASLNLEINV